MFGINGNSSTSGAPADGATPAMPMVPNSDGIDEPVHAPAVPPNPPSEAPSAPPMPDAPVTYDLSVPTPTAAPAPAQASPAAPSAPPVTTAAKGQAANDLINLKQQALQNLAPLVDHLDQTPEERFKTTMMMLQASDNPDLVKEAYAAANAITDEKVRAQALLDVVNEINYFTQHNASSSPVA